LVLRRSFMKAALLGQAAARRPRAAKLRPSSFHANSVIRIDRNSSQRGAVLPCENFASVDGSGNRQKNAYIRRSGLRSFEKVGSFSRSHASFERREPSRDLSGRAFMRD
jgi:hypothetical protein